MRNIKDRYRQVCDRHFGVEISWDLSTHGSECPHCKFEKLLEDSLTGDVKDEYEERIRMLNYEIEDHEDHEDQYYNLQEELEETRLKLKELQENKYEE